MQSTPFPDQCVYCHKSSGELLGMDLQEKEVKTHYECRQGKACGLCGYTGMTELCAQPECFRVLHPWCLKMFTNSSKTQLCDIHSLGKKRERYSHIRQTLTRVPFNPPLVQSLRRLDKSRKHHSAACCTGYVFWYLVNSQYFPSGVDLSSFPDFRKGRLSASEASEVLDEWNPSGTSAVDSLLEDVVTRLSLNRSHVESLKSELLATIEESSLRDSSDSFAKLASRKPKDQNSEERFLLNDLRLLGIRPVYEDFFKYIEAKQRSGSGDILQTAAIGSSLSVRVSQLPKCEDEYACAVCSDGDYEDDNLIVICSCYGVPVLPSDDWICAMCSAYGKETSKLMRCVLCPVPGGALKPTVHRNSGKQYAYYPVHDTTQPASFENPDYIWCHVYCALRIPGVSIADRDSMCGIDISKVDAERFRSRCNVCCSDHGACLNCHHRKCEFAFHPECGKELLVTWKKFGLEEEDVFCLNHRPIKLGKMIENRDKKKIEDIQNFTRLWEKWESKPNLGSSFRPHRHADERPWTFEESEQLEREIVRFLHKVNEKQTKPFELVVNMKNINRGSAVHMSIPEVYNSLSPEAILTEGISIRGRSPKECYGFFQAKLMLRMKFELELCKSSVKVYIPKKRRRTNTERKIEEPIKRPKKRWSYKEPSLSQKSHEGTSSVPRSPPLHQPHWSSPSPHKNDHFQQAIS